MFQALHGQGNAIYLGRIRFGDDGMTHARLQFVRMLGAGYVAGIAGQ